MLVTAVAVSCNGSAVMLLGQALVLSMCVWCEAVSFGREVVLLGGQDLHEWCAHTVVFISSSPAVAT